VKISFKLTSVAMIASMAFVSPILAKSPAMCLAKNIYFEAKNQGTAGWAAVASVTLNRVNDTRYPNSICEVVYQGPARPSWQDPELMIPIRHKCQFSWYCDGKSDVMRNTSKREEIIKFAEYVLSTKFDLDITDGATHYHADYVYPAWAKTKTKTIEIGDHIFYRWEK
jgi:spore germination cell wall hydrolase CwlJ-like protein